MVASVVRFRVHRDRRRRVQQAAQRVVGDRNHRLRREAELEGTDVQYLAAARAALALQHDVARALSPQRAFVPATILAATVVAGALLAAFELVSQR